MSRSTEFPKMATLADPSLLSGVTMWSRSHRSRFAKRRSKLRRMEDELALSLVPQIPGQVTQIGSWQMGLEGRTRPASPLWPRDHPGPKAKRSFQQRPI